MKVTKAAWVENPTTEPPKTKGSWAAFLVDGKEVWYDLATDAADGVTDADMDFEKGRQWAAQEREKEAEGEQE